MRSPAVLALGVYAAVALVMTGSALFGDETLGPYAVTDCCDVMLRTDPAPPHPFAEDPSTAVQDYPRERMFARGLAAGRIAEWNPYAGAGTPLWAEQGGPFFPLKLPVYLSPDMTGIDVFLMLRLVVAALGARALARARGRGQAAAFAAGLLYEVSGVMVAQLSFVVAGGMCVLPWVVYGAQLLSAGRWRAGVAASAIGLAAAFHAGHPPIGLLVWLAFAIAIAAHAVRRAIARRRGDAVRLCAAAAVAGILGGAMAAPVLAPLVELEGQAVSYKETATAAWAWQLTRNKNDAMLPVALFAPSLYHEYRRPMLGTWPWPYSPALGVIALVLAVAALPFAVDVGLAALGVAGVILSTGPPGLGWVHELPGLGYILPSYGWALLVLPLTQSAAHMVELLDDRRVQRAVAATLALAVVAAVIGFAAITDHLLPAAPLKRILVVGLGDGGNLVRMLAPYVVVATALVLAPAARGRLGLALVLLGAVEALSNDVGVIGERRSRVIEAPPPAPVRLLAEGLADGQGRVHALPFANARPHVLSIFGVPDLRYSGPMPPSRLADYFAAMRSPRRYFVQHYPMVASSPLLDLAAVRFVVLDTKNNGARFDDRLVLVYADRGIRIYRNTAALPRVRVAASIVPSRNRDAAVAHVHLLAAGWRHAQPDSSVAVEPDADGRPAESLGATSGDARIVDASDPDRLVVSASLARPGYVVVADTYTSGWRATVDGVETPIHPADVLFRAVRVPAVRHEIVLSYRPAGLRIGAGLFVVGLLATLGIALWPRRRA